ncbi:MAG: GH25 family lysozyme [bacterium]|nr:GH25 family lysozyme [bacterium]
MSKRSRRKRKKRIMLGISIGLPVAIIAVGIAIVLNITGKKGTAEQGTEETPVIAVPTATATPEPTPEVAVEAEPVEIIAADVADMNDTEDPGAQTEDGESVNVTDALKSSQFETSDMSIGIDVAKYQGTIDWPSVAASGVQFAIIRVGYRTQKTGIIYEDPCAKYNLQQAQAAGLKLGAYFFSTAVNEQEAQEEAAWVTNYIAQYKITYPVVYNCEGFKSADSRQYGLDKNTRSNCAVKFLDYVAAKGYTPMFYAARNELRDDTDWNTTTLSSKYKIWVSQYPDPPFPATSAPDYTGSYAMWQYTNAGAISGIKKGVDVNVAYFGYTQEAEAKDSTPYEMVAADPEVGITFTEVNDTVTAKSETNLRSVPSSADSSTIVAKLVYGDTANRTGIGNNGWARVIYNGQKLYAVNSYLTNDPNYAANTVPAAATNDAAAPAATTDKTADSLYSPVNELVTAKEETNLRTYPSTETGQVYALIKHGDTVTRTGIGSNGWSRISYDGQTLYAVTSFLQVAQ